MSDYDWWRAQLDGENPETHPGEPYCGYYVSEHYVSLPLALPTRKGSSIQRAKISCPVAIWREPDGGLCAQVMVLTKTITYQHHDEIDDLFGSCCRAAIEYERYVEMVTIIENWRKGRGNGNGREGI